MEKQTADQATLYALSDFFKVMGDATRIRILWALDCREKCVQELCSELDMSKSAVSHQLRILKDAKLVRYRKEGKFVYYALNDEHMRSIVELGLTHVTHD